MGVRFVDVTGAVAAIRDGATVATDGFTMMGVAESVLAGMERSFLATGHPRALTLVHSSGQSAGRGGLEHLAHPGLLARVVGSHWGLMPGVAALLEAEQAEAICLPQGQLSALFRAIAAGRPGVLSTVGIDTFVDPRQQGGKVNAAARAGAPDYVRMMPVDDAEMLLYKSFPIDVGIIRATSVDEHGNCALQEEAVLLDALPIAQAVHNSGGTVICQAKNLVPAGALPPKSVVVPGCLVDLVVVARDPRREHRQTESVDFDPIFVSATGPRTPRPRPAVDGPRQHVGGAVPVDRRTAGAAVARRAVACLRDGDVINIGTGLPGDTIGDALAETHRSDSVTVTVESGTYGGIPAGGPDFGVAATPSAIIPHAAQFDFYDGGGLDATFMGAGEVDRNGNVNVSLLGRRIVGCGGFIDITSRARRVYFCFLLGGRHAKFVPSLAQQTFPAGRALEAGQQVRYITERGVFELTPAGLRLLEVADGFDARRDVLPLLPFPVQVAPSLGPS